MRPSTEDELISVLRDIAAAAGASDAQSVANTTHLIEAFGGYMSELAATLKAEERQAALVSVLASINETLKKLPSSSSSSLPSLSPSSSSPKSINVAVKQQSYDGYYDGDYDGYWAGYYAGGDGVKSR